MKKATSSGRSTFDIAALLIRIATQVSSSGGSIATVRPQPKRDFKPLFEAVHLLRISIAGQDHLLLALEQRVEGMEKLLLRSVLAREELDVVDHERVERSIRGLEIIDGVVLQGLHHLAHEALAVHVGDARIRSCAP